MPEISPSTQKLISEYINWHQSFQAKEGTPTIHTDEVVSKVASFYEKIRGVVEWKEEHLLRKTAIERILKRRLFLKKNGQLEAEPFIKELIRGGHFPNDIIEEEKIEEVQKIINKYVFILGHASSPQKSEAKLHAWISAIAACEVEETLAPPLREKALINYATELLKEKIKVEEKNRISEEETEIQIYIAAQQALFRFDSYIISYHLLLKKFPDWKNLDSEKLEQVTKNVYLIQKEIEKELNHPLSGKFYKICEKYDTPYLILGDIFSENPYQASKILSNPEELESKIRESYRKRLKKLKSRMKRAAIFSVISIFVTKILLVFAVEVPFDKYIPPLFGNPSSFSYFSLAINVSIPPLLMLLLILTIKPPKKSNLQRVIMETTKIAYKTKREETYLLRAPVKKGMILTAVINFLYLICFVATFGILIWGFGRLNRLELFKFGYLSQAIFIIFISLIAFAGTKIRETSNELLVEEKKETIFQAFVEIFAVPFLRMGRWLSNQWAKYNLIVMLFNSLLDMPFQVFTEFLEHWRDFLKEKKEEIH